MNSQKSSKDIASIRPVENQKKPAIKKPLTRADAHDEVEKLRNERDHLENDPTPNDNDVRSSIP